MVPKKQGQRPSRGAKEPTQEVVVYALKVRTVRNNPRASSSDIFFSLEGHARSRTLRSLQSRFCRARTSNLSKLLRQQHTHSPRRAGSTYAATRPALPPACGT